MLTALPTTHDEAPAYGVSFIAAPPAPADYPDLRAVHAQLLPLAQQAGHTRLVLMEQVGFADSPSYQAYGAGGAVEMHIYIVAGRPEGCAADFARVLQERLQEAADKVTANCAQL